MENKIKDNNYHREIGILKSYYDEFDRNIPATGKNEVVSKNELKPDR
jgi:hypothetical protein